MTTPRPAAASVRQRLQNRSRAQSEDFQLLLTRYALERLLYRLSLSSHRDQFILKGAMLFALWAEQPHRPTRDLDLLGYGPPDLARLEAIFRDICATTPEEDDGLDFRADTLEVAPIRKEAIYDGVRVTFLVYLGKAFISVQVDVGFGDAVVPAATEVAYPTLLNQPPPRLRSYPPEAVIAEKLHAMTTLGLANSRLKDFYDIAWLARHQSFEGLRLAAAVQHTFARRETSLPQQAPVALTARFATDEQKQAQWRAFLRKNKLQEPAGGLAQVVEELAVFLLPLLSTSSEDLGQWAAGGPWTPVSGARSS